MRKKLLWTLFALMLFVGVPAPADDSDIFMSGSTVEPNIVILVDTSGSMNDPIGGTPKIDIAKTVVNDLITNVKGVNIGVFAFRKGGGKIVSPVGTENATMIDAVNDLSASGATPLGGAAGDIAEYFEALYAAGGGTIGGSGDAGAPDFCEVPGDDEDDEMVVVKVVDDEDEDEDTDEPYDACESLTDPIEFECQRSYAILMTDGMPTGEDVNLVVQNSEAMYTNDFSSFPGVQNVVVHTVGFDVPEGAALLTEAATKGGGNFYTASNATTLYTALSNAISQVVEDSYSFTMPLIPTTSATGGTKAYVAGFRPNAVKPFWQGHLRAYTRDSNGLIPLNADGEPQASALAWDAATALNARTATSRTIKTVIGGTQVDFATATAGLTPTVLGVASKGDRDALINFIRGVDSYDEDGDGNTTESRDNKLGDIFHSTPVLVFPPPLHSTDSSYQAFQTANKNRTTVVLAGSNDGMLHAFKESDGDELWAFIPPDLLGNLKSLSAVVGTHPYFVDSSPIVADIKVGSAWKTVVVFGERRGGGYYHALDITNTTSPTYMWGFTDSKIDESWSEPAVGKIKLSNGTEKYVAFVGGGYNTEANNAHGKAMFAIDLATGNKLWEYSNTGTGDAQYMNFSIPASPLAVDLNRDGFIDRVYVGDVGGQLWKFDTSNAGVLSGGLVSNWSGKRLFAAAASQTNPPAAGEFYPAQAMYGSPVLAYDGYGDLWVYIGTGDRNHPNAPSTNRLYGIKDNTTMANGATLTEANLVSATSTTTATQGWYLTLPANEKAISAAEVFNDIAYFSTFTPTTVAACGSSGGTGRLYAMQTDNGHAAVDWSTGNELTSTDGSETRDKVIGDGIPSDPDIVLGDNSDTLVVATTDEEVSDDSLQRNRSKRVRYWREVFAEDSYVDDNPTEQPPGDKPNEEPYQDYDPSGHHN